MSFLCPRVCDNKNEFGYCRTTWCINPQYSNIGTAQYGQGVQKAVVTNADTETIYGYPVKDLIVFAELCRRHDITEDELHTFVNNFSLAYQFAIEEQNREAKEMVQRMLDGIISRVHTFKIPEVKETDEPCDHFLIPSVNDEDHTLDFKIGGD